MLKVPTFDFLPNYWEGEILNRRVERRKTEVRRLKAERPNIE